MEQLLRVDDNVCHIDFIDPFRMMAHVMRYYSVNIVSERGKYTSEPFLIF